MSDLLTAAAQALGTPEAIVQRSASARAQASGTTAEAILEAWASGGKAAAATPAPQTSPEPAAPAEPENDVQPEQEPVADRAPAPSAAPAQATVPVPVATVVEPPEPALAPYPVRERVKKAGRAGAGVGGLGAVLFALVAAPWLASRTLMVGGETSGFEVAGAWLLAGGAILGLVMGALVAVIVRGASTDPRMRLANAYGSSALIGAVAGVVFGLLIAGVILGLGSNSEQTEGAVVIPTFGAIGWWILGWALSGWIVAAAVHVIGVPSELSHDETEEIDSVRERLSSAIGIPVMVVVSILALVLPLAFVFINFPEWAPLLGIVVAGGILALAGLSASSPRMRVRPKELAVAFLALATVLVIIITVLAVREGGEDEAAPTTASIATLA